MVALVALRLSLGWHFLYEGVWKIKHSDEFSAEPFLTGAKGPLSPVFFAMIYDINGKQRLAVVEVEVEKDGKTVTKKRIASFEHLTAGWEDLKDRFLAYYKPRSGADEETLAEYKKLEESATKLYDARILEAEEYLDGEIEDIEAYLAKLDAFKNDPERSQRAPFQQQQQWQKMLDLRTEAGGWIKGLEHRESAYKSALFDLLSDKQQARGAAFGGWNPFRWNRIQLINFAVTYGLTAIGLCLMAGFFTRLAALGGAAFMFFVVLTTWSWPGVYPFDPGPVGHIMLIGKDFIEMIALLVVASTVVGRWGGLDFFVHNLVVEPFLSKVLHNRKS